MGQKARGLTVFYDGSCSVCKREMEHYRKRDTRRMLTLIDIAAPSFDPSEYGRGLNTFMAKLHVRDKDGNFFTGVDAFARIWEVMPQPELHLLAAVVGLPVISLMARGGYWMFAHSRKFLPKIARDCTDGTCHVDSH